MYRIFDKFSNISSFNNSDMNIMMYLDCVKIGVLE